MNLDFTFEPKITKSYLLSQYSEETYMEYYLGIKVAKGLFCSPLRRDNTPTCSFYKNKSGELIFKDFNGSFYGNFISVVMKKYHVSYYKALQIIAEDFNLSKRHTDKVVVNPIKPSTTVFKDTGPADVRVEIKDFTQEELNWWNSYGITLDILKKFNVYSCKNIFLNGELFKTIYKDNFMFGYYGGKKDNLELWRIYFPKQSNYRFLTNWPAKKIQGLKQLKKDGDICVITKSMKDTMCLYSLGISAIAPNSENLFIADTILERLKSKFKYIIVLYDSDLPGIQNMRKIKKKHPELIYFYIPRHYNAKDISDFYKKYGKDKTLEFVKDNLNKLK
jgi:hypothetical protein